MRPAHAMWRAKQFEALLLDLDGVLVDSDAVVERHWRRFARKHGIPLEEILRVSRGRRSVETIALVAPHLDAAAEAREIAASESVDANGLRIMAGAREAVEAARLGPWSVVTSGSRAIALLRLRSCDLPVPEILITADDVGTGKPDPEGYLAAAGRLGVPPARCLVVEDADAGIEAARRAGMCRLRIGRAQEDGVPGIPDLSWASIRWLGSHGRFAVQLTMTRDAGGSGGE